MSGQLVTGTEKRALHEAIFRWEQDNSVCLSVGAAMAAFDVTAARGWEKVDKSLRLNPFVRCLTAPL